MEIIREPLPETPTFTALQAAAKHFETCPECKVFERCAEYNKLMAEYHEVCAVQQKGTAT
jgi:hypothetical protein